jgi:predicted alpha/beta superfamily hydrolase
MEPPPAAGQDDGGSMPPDADAGPPDAAPASDAGSPDAPHDAGTTTLVRVHYPAGSHTIAIRGSAGSLTWSKGIAATAGVDDTWALELPKLAAPVEWKPLLDDATWSRGPNYQLSPGQTVDVYPHFTTTQGSVERHWPSFTSQAYPSTRGIWLYLPPTYLENSRAKMPVLYMHDGQNLFEPGISLSGAEWKVDETMDAAAEDGSIREAIVVGVESTSDRDNELTPPPLGKGDKYLQMLTTEIKPMIDAQLRTLPDRANTGICGSSLGGLISAWAGVHHADAFAFAGVMSPSVWWNNRQILGDVATIPQQPSRVDRVYVDSGDSDQEDGYSDTKDLDAQYVTAGYVEGTSLHYVVQPGALHSEVYWAQRFPGGAAFLLGPGR